MYFGTGLDAYIGFDSANLRIDTDEVAPSDLIIACGAEKTVRLVTPVWEDLQFQVTPGKQPSSNNPTWATLTTNTGEWGFGTDDYVDLASNELSHGWKEGTTGNFHLHISIPNAVTGADDLAQFTVYIAYVNSSGVWTETSLTEEDTFPLAGSVNLLNFYLDMGDVSFAGLLIGTQVKIRVKRIACSDGPKEYPSDVFIHQVGCHLEFDTMGSRTEIVK